jgi:hypothetical protein
LSLLCAGCIIIPIPEHAAYVYRAPIGEESLGFLEVGSTTIEEVLLNLGEPDHTRDNERDFIYQWSKESGLVFLDFAPGVASGAHKYTYYKTYQLLIEFDDIGIVKGFETKEEDEGSSVKELF